MQDRKINLIYNGIADTSSTDLPLLFKKRKKISIVYSARVNDVKRQLLIVDHLKNKLHKDIEIQFAGKGPDFEVLEAKCKNTANFKALGFVENVDELVKQADFLMLFSTQEGLPISLIEGIMHGKPLLVNDVGGNLEIGVPNFNAIELRENWDSLADTINSIAELTVADYQRMSTNSRKHYEKMFTYNTMVSAYVRLIDAI